MSHYVTLVAIDDGGGKLSWMGTWTASTLYDGEQEFHPDSNPMCWPLEKVTRNGRTFSFIAGNLDGKRRSWSFRIPDDAAPGDVREIDLETSDGSPLKMMCTFAPW